MLLQSKVFDMIHAATVERDEASGKRRPAPSVTQETPTQFKKLEVMLFKLNSPDEHGGRDLDFKIEFGMPEEEKKPPSLHTRSRLEERG